MESGPSGPDSSPPPPFGIIDQIKVGLIFLTRLPVLYQRPMPADALARATWTFPLVGALVGSIGAAVSALGIVAGLGDVPVALLVLAATVLLTGAMHEDGLADSADGLGGGATVERKLAVMRDSRIGTYGVLALLFSVSLRAALIAALAQAPAGHLPAALIAAHAASRAGLPLVMRLLSPSRPGGLGAAAGRPTTMVAAIAALFGCALAVVAYGGLPGLIPAAAAALGIAFVAWLARRQIGGYTGDVLGAAQQVGEVAGLLAANLWMVQSMENFL
ncbi:MAG TPA: adenosylcobinamide-GDP ribazoletransferase [Stellaceae bacterium]|nr:adenosylcobinamide-GDP ribazoletransferase [Stellaceae bacterium]